MLQLRVYISVFCCLCTLPLLAQNQLIGTWELVSQKMVNPDGTEEVYDRSTIKSYKVITPTHFMVIAEKPQKSGSKFDYATGGTYTLRGNTYVESMDIASWENYTTNKTDFTAKVEGNKFYQKGTVITDKGEKYFFDEVWQKTELPAQANNEVLGTWTLVSENGTARNGAAYSRDQSQVRIMRLITPTHWIQISEDLKGNKPVFENAIIGTYTLKGQTVYPKLIVASFPVNASDKSELTYKLEGNKLMQSGITTYDDGQTHKWNEVFQRVSSTKAKPVSTGNK